MNTFITRTTLLVFSILLTACGGGDGDEGGSISVGGSNSGGTSAGTSATGSEAVASTQIENTSDIVAARDFSFDVGEKIMLTIQQSSSTKGVIYIYERIEHTFEDGSVAPDPLSHVTTIYPSQTPTIELEVNTNWENLYLQWVPMSSSETEQTWTLPLNESSNSYLLSF